MKGLPAARHGKCFRCGDRFRPQDERLTWEGERVCAVCLTYLQALQGALAQVLGRRRSSLAGRGPGKVRPR